MTIVAELREVQAIEGRRADVGFHSVLGGLGRRPAVVVVVDGGCEAVDRVDVGADAGLLVDVEAGSWLEAVHRLDGHRVAGDGDGLAGVELGVGSGHGSAPLGGADEVAREGGSGVSAVVLRRSISCQRISGSVGGVVSISKWNDVS